jgi:hypothetical protein
MNKKEETKQDKIILTLDQIRGVVKELEEAGGEQQFLLNKGAIKIHDEQIFVVQVEGLIGTPADYGFAYQSEFPYAFYQEVLAQVGKYLKRKAIAKKKEMQAFEEMAEQNAN